MCEGDKNGGNKREYNHMSMRSKTKENLGKHEWERIGERGKEIHVDV